MPVYSWRHFALVAAAAGGIYVAEKHSDFKSVAFCSIDSKIKKEKFVKMKIDRHTKYYDIGKLLGKGAFGEVR